jgi:hypothetical protein
VKHTVRACRVEQPLRILPPGEIDVAAPGDDDVIALPLEALDET